MICQHHDKNDWTSIRAQLADIAITSSSTFMIILTNPILHNPKLAPSELAQQLDSWMPARGLGHWASHVQPSSCATFQDSKTMKSIFFKEMTNVSWHLKSYVAAHSPGASARAQLVNIMIKANSKFIIILTNPTLPRFESVQWILWFVKIMINVTGHLTWDYITAFSSLFWPILHSFAIPSLHLLSWLCS